MEALLVRYAVQFLSMMDLLRLKTNPWTIVRVLITLQFVASQPLSMANSPDKADYKIYSINGGYTEDSPRIEQALETNPACQKAICFLLVPRDDGGAYFDAYISLMPSGNEFATDDNKPYFRIGSQWYPSTLEQILSPNLDLRHAQSFAAWASWILPVLTVYRAAEVTLTGMASSAVRAKVFLQFASGELTEDQAIASLSSLSCPSGVCGQQTLAVLAGEFFWLTSPSTQIRPISRLRIFLAGVESLNKLAIEIHRQRTSSTLVDTFFSMANGVATAQFGGHFYERAQIEAVLAHNISRVDPSKSFLAVRIVGPEDVNTAAGWDRLHDSMTHFIDYIVDFQGSNAWKALGEQSP